MNYDCVEISKFDPDLSVEEVEDSEEEKPIIATFKGDDLIVKTYIREIVKVRLLTKEEEVFHKKCIEDGWEAKKEILKLKRSGVIDDDKMNLLSLRVKKGESSREVMITSNLRLVVSIAKRYWKATLRSSISFMDIIEEGNLGLIKAVSRFSWEKGCRFSTYATWWIVQSIERFLHVMSKTINIPHSQRYGRLIAFKYELETENGRKLSTDEVAIEYSKKFEVPLENVRHMMNMIQPMHSLDSTIENEKGDTSPLKNFLSDERPSVLDELEKRSVNEKLRSITSQLPEKERAILHLRHGLQELGPLSRSSMPPCIQAFVNSLTSSEKEVFYAGFGMRKTTLKLKSSFADFAKLMKKNLSDDEKEKFIEWIRYNVSESGLTLEALGILYNVSRERIRQIENLALEKLRKYPNKDRLKELI